MNQSLKNSELVREHIEHLLPTDEVIDKEKLNINLMYLTDASKEINPDVPISMTTVFGIYSMSNFASQFQWKINMNGSKIPVNAVCFLLSKSGNGKDSTLNAQRKAMDPGYVVLEQERESVAQTKAREAAEQADGDASNWQKHYKPPMPLENTISTVEGMVSRLNAFAQAGLGMPTVISTEIGSELGSNPNIADNIRLISELYDVGEYKSKAIKDSERQDKPVRGMGMPAMFAGSEDNIILDKSISAVFRREFVTKLARRSYFVYPTVEEHIEAAVDYTTYEDMVGKQGLFERMTAESKAFIGSATMDIASQLIDNDHRLMDIDEDALRAYKDYKMYTSSLANGIDYVHKSVELEQMHRSWKMLKLAGVFCLWDLRDSISIQDIEEAIYVTEMLGKYLAYYEEYAAKELYELMADYFKLHPEHKLSLHDLKKRGFITGTSGLESRVKELVKMADSLAGSEGMVKFENDLVSFKAFEAVGDHFASYVQVSGSKQERATQCHSGFVNKATSFGKLKAILENDTAYTPFKFIDGKRKNENIISGATWIALDVDDSDITINEMHDILQDYNHHISSTSNSDNPYKFRIILELSTIVDIPVREWKQFIVNVSAELGIEMDPVSCTKSQIMFGYKGSKVLSTLDSDPYDVSEALKKAMNSVSESFNKETKLTRTQMSKALDNPLETFNYAFNDDVTARSLTLFRVWKQAKDLGATADMCEKLMNDLNYGFWSDGVDDKRFESYVKQMRESYKDEGGFSE